MPIYEYECARGHVTEKMASLAERTETYPCAYARCELVAIRVLSATSTSFRLNDRKAFKGRNK